MDLRMNPDEPDGMCVVCGEPTTTVRDYYCDDCYEKEQLKLDSETKEVKQLSYDYYVGKRMQLKNGIFKDKVVSVIRKVENDTDKELYEVKVEDTGDLILCQINQLCFVSE